ncbi:energy-coupling factor transporter transmembrane protein EcfT [Clostridiales bacterium COT073_COT-073]|nr:energy-coupling factor transporter transmembrane protein EcfT [Clostridiales bacterium COT073_COT-073]
MIQERQKPTFLRKLNPITKLWLSLALSFAIVLFQNYYFSIVVLIVGIIWIFLEKYFLEFKVVGFAILTLALSMFLINGTLNPVNDFTKEPVFVLPLLNWKFYKEGLEYALKYFLRIAPLMASLFLLFRTINMTDLGAAMHEAGLSYRSAFIFVSTFQILPTLVKDMQQITDAQKARGLETEGSLKKRFMAFLPIMVPVVSNAIMKVQNQAIAMETKGFNSTAKKTIYRDLEKTKIDRILKYASIITIVASLLYRIF